MKIIITGCGGFIRSGFAKLATAPDTDPRHNFEMNALGTLNLTGAVRRFVPCAEFVCASEIQRVSAS